MRADSRFGLAPRRGWLCWLRLERAVLANPRISRCAVSPSRTLLHSGMRRRWWASTSASETPTDTRSTSRTVGLGLWVGPDSVGVLQFVPGVEVAGHGEETVRVDAILDSQRFSDVLSRIGLSIWCKVLRFVWKAGSCGKGMGHPQDLDHPSRTAHPGDGVKDTFPISPSFCVV